MSVLFINILTLLKVKIIGLRQIHEHATFISYRGYMSLQINERLNAWNILHHSATVTFLLTSKEQQLALTNICDVIEENWAIFLFSK